MFFDSTFRFAIKPFFPRFSISVFESIISVSRLIWLLMDFRIRNNFYPTRRQGWYKEKKLGKQMSSTPPGSRQIAKCLSPGLESSLFLGMRDFFLLFCFFPPLNMVMEE